MPWRALLEYKASISPFSIRQSNFLKRVTQAHPAKLYIPMAVAHLNLDIIKATTWKDTPASIRQPRKSQPNQPTDHQTQTSMTNNNQKKQCKTSQDTSTTRFYNKPDIQHRLDNTQQSLMDTNTTSSLMTKSLATQQQF